MGLGVLGPPQLEPAPCPKSPPPEAPVVRFATLLRLLLSGRYDDSPRFYF